MDGRLDAAGEFPGAISVNDHNVCIGENEQVPGRQFHGLIDDVRIYERALSAGEITALCEWREAPAQAAPPAGTDPIRWPSPLLSGLDSLMMKGDGAGALSWATKAAADEKYTTLASQIASVPNVCNALEARGKAALAAARARRGEEVKLAAATGPPRKGEVKEVGDKGIDLVTKFVIAAGGKRYERGKRITVEWAHLSLDQMDALAHEGGWRADEDAAMARAYLSLGRGKLDAAAKALEGAAVGFMCRAAFRHHNLSPRPYHTLGFRAVVSGDPEAEAETPKGTMSGPAAAIVAEIVATGTMEEVYWNSLGARIIEVEAGSEKGVDTGIDCEAATTYLVIPHPKDQWADGQVAAGYGGREDEKSAGRNPQASLCVTVGSDAVEGRVAVKLKPTVSGKSGRLKLVANDRPGAAYKDNRGRIRAKVVIVAAPDGGGARGPSSTTAATIAGRWYYEERGTGYSREFTAYGKCVFRKGETFIWSVPYRVTGGKAIVAMADGMVLVHQITADGRLDIEGEYLASRR